MVSRGEEALIICSICTFLGFTFVCLRCHCRFCLVSNWGIEDLLIIAAIPFSLAFTLLVDYGRRRGTGHHSWDLQPQQSSDIMKSMFFCIITYNVGLTLTKISILTQMLRFFFEPRQRRAIWVFIGIIVCYATAGAFATFFACIPLPYFWDRSIPGGHCYDYPKGWYAMGAVNIATDLAICILPVPMLKYLKLPARQKYGLMLVFALGGFTCVVAALRFPSIIRLAQNNDASYDFYGPSVWSSVELNTGIICACLPNLRPLISRIFPRLLSGSSNGSHNHSCLRNRMRDWVRRNTNIDLPIHHVHSHRHHGHNHDRNRPRTSNFGGRGNHNNMQLSMNGLGTMGTDDDDFDYDSTTVNNSTRMSTTLVHTPNLCKCIPDKDIEKLSAPSQPTEIDSFDKLAVAYGTKYEWSITADPNPYNKKG